MIPSILNSVYRQQSIITVGGTAPDNKAFFIFYKIKNIKDASSPIASRQVWLSEDVRMFIPEDNTSDATVPGGNDPDSIGLVDKRTGNLIALWYKVDFAEYPAIFTNDAGASAADWISFCSVIMGNINKY